MQKSYLLSFCFYFFKNGLVRHMENSNEKYFDTSFYYILTVHPEASPWSLWNRFIFHASFDSVEVIFNQLLCDISSVGCVRWGGVMQVIATDLCKPLCPIWPAAHHRTWYRLVSVSTSVRLYCLSCSQLMYRPDRWLGWSTDPSHKVVNNLTLFSLPPSRSVWPIPSSSGHNPWEPLYVHIAINCTSTEFNSKITYAAALE